jgi:hypothetical protein
MNTATAKYVLETAIDGAKMSVLEWLDMKTAPHDSDIYIVVKPKVGELMVVRWCGFGDTGWWLPEGALFQDDDLLGWSPVPK